MKFKKFLCLTLTTTIAFTATLGSSASIFADDTDTQGTDGSQNFGSLILEKMKNEYENSNDNTISIVDSNNSGSEISPMWNAGTHDEIITNNYSGYIPEKYIDLVMKLCRWCDEPDRVYRADCMHGSKNYVASLKFLWKFAQVIGDKNISGTYSQLSANAKNVALAQFDNKLIKKNNSNDEYTKLVDLAIRTEAIINVYGKEKTPEERKYLIYGVILHLLGDLNAHRTIVPQFMVDRATDPKYAKSENRFVKSNFKNKEWLRITDGVKLGTLSFSEIKRKLNPNRQSDEAQKNKNSPYHQIRRRYEDNPNVVPNRVLAAETMAEYFMHYFNSGFDISILDNIPYANVKLKNYSRYRREAL